MHPVREALKKNFEGKIPYTELVALENEINTALGLKLVLGEALTDSDEKKVEQIVNKVLKSKKSEEQFLKFSKNVLTSLFKLLYVRRSLWRDGLILAQD